MPQEPDFLPLSALQHWCYCPRQCGLIHLEQAFDDNVHTLRGQAVHTMVDQPGVETVKGRRVERALPVWSERIGLIGKCDVVEFGPDGAPYPVEYKHGSRDKAAGVAACDELQLAAQALCLEEMTGHLIGEGAIYYASSRRRRAVTISAALRAAVEATAQAVREMLGSRRLPPALPSGMRSKRCRHCSLHERCQPELADIRWRDAREALFDPDA
ncbi:CRISPR-associated protein Cas4 [Aquabacterium sp. A7-Y]|uniref:CRISPR-associated protein Cas4 n=1 Tax=Aquabacterium sp. A7-Y TaxID=1349605 RepID=UPI00223CC5C8|nr:CRISPR-associated protein Cas4 [Aquabacterium sp. A7-Y]MCW7540486.1 CRISPR-associated protein Cas4 [Aquabacterium sp. A7-Y]